LRSPLVKSSCGFSQELIRLDEEFVFW